MPLKDNQENSLILHLEELRQTLIRCFLALGLLLPATLLSAPYMLDILIKHLTEGLQITVNFFTPLEVFILQIKTAILADILVCFPYIAKQLWAFILPALYENERKFIKSIVLTSSILFITGTLFCLFFILPLIIRFGASFVNNEIHAVFGISNIAELSLSMSVIFGLMFQFPLITYSLIRSGIASYAVVKDKRPYIFTLILIFAAIVTPPDIVSQIMLAVPTYILFELGLYFAKNALKSKKTLDLE